MKKKTLTIAIALVLVVALAVGATYAYLSALWLFRTSKCALRTVRLATAT